MTDQALANSNESVFDRIVWVNGDDRMKFLPKYFGPAMIYFEDLFYSLADKSIEGYIGGMWEFALIDNQVPFLYLSGDNHFVTVTNPMYGQSAKLPMILAGLFTTALAIEALLSKCPTLVSAKKHNVLCEYHGQLISYGYDLAELWNCSSAYFSLVD